MNLCVCTNVCVHNSSSCPVFVCLLCHPKLKGFQFVCCLLSVCLIEILRALYFLYARSTNFSASPSGYETIFLLKVATADGDDDDATTEFC